MHVWITSRIFGKEESREVYFCMFQMIQAAKDSHGVNSALKGLTVVMQQMSRTTQRAKEKFAEWEMQMYIPILENGFNEETCS